MQPIGTKCHKHRIRIQCRHS